MFIGDVEFRASLTVESPSFLFMGDISAYRMTLQQGLVSVGGYVRGGRFVQGYKRADLLANTAANVAKSKSAEKLAALSAKTAVTSKIPSRSEIKDALGAVGQDIRSAPLKMVNPLKLIKEGREREAFVKQSIEAATGKKIPSNPEIIAAGFKKGSKAAADFVKNNPDLIEDMAVNGVGFASSIGGGVTGDLVGALAARKAITDVKAVLKARKALKSDPGFQSAGTWGKIKQIRRKAIEELKASSEKIKDNAVGDTSGWLVGNTTAAALNPVPVAGNIPLVGAAVAMPVAPKIVKAARRIRQGESLELVAKETAKEIKNIPADAIRAGNERERKLREYLERRMLERRKQVLLMMKEDLRSA